MTSNSSEDFSLLRIESAMVSLKEILFSFLMVLIPEITSEAKSKFLMISFRLFSGTTLKVSAVGHFEIIKASEISRWAICCQISSEINGTKGCSIFKLSSKMEITCRYVFSEIDSPKAGFTISKNQEQKSSQINL